MATKYTNIAFAAAAFSADSGNDEITNVANQTLSGTCTIGSGGSGTDKIWISIDGTNWTDVVTAGGTIGTGLDGSTVSWSIPITLLESSHTIYAIASSGSKPTTTVGTTQLAYTYDATAPNAPSAPSVPEAAGTLTAAEAADGTVVAVDLTGTGAAAGDTVHVAWGAQDIAQTLTATDITNHSVNVTVGAGAISTEGMNNHTFNVTASIVDLAGNSSGASSATSVTAVCFLKGTRIRTPSGEVAVEDLKIGDPVSTASGATRAIKWIGRRSFVTRFLASGNRRNVLPIRIARGALEDNIPQRDLFVSPEHALCLDGALIPARHLVNGRSIAYCESLETIEYYHIELPVHDVLVAEGAAAESWLDCGNRNFFVNVMDYLALGLPDTAPAKACLPFVEAGPVLDQVRTKLLARATSTGHETTTDPDLHLIVDGARIRPARQEGKVCVFELATTPAQLAVGSLSVTPADLDPAAKDSRQLGVSIKRIVMRATGTELQIGHDHPMLTDGFHAAEASHRWTNGAGIIPQQFLACMSGKVQVEVHLGGLATKYPKPVEAPAQATQDGQVKRGSHLRLAA